ncbi:hypothetical protein LMG24235_01906 [Paraburkholderia sabiae]|nr:hypothetical protein LMG24235_01906 [Paraburkholderia sabiae]
MAENTHGVLLIPVDDSQFAEFLRKFEKYREEAKEGADPWAGSAQNAREAADSAAALDAHMAHTAQIVNSSKMTGTQSYSFLFAQNIHFAARDSEKILKNTDKTNRSLVATIRSWTNLSGLRKDFLKVGGTALAAGGAIVNATNDLSKKNLEARQLNLPIGTADAFESDYQPLGLKRSDISNFANAKEDSRLWKPLIAAGLSVDQIKGLDPDELAIAFARAAGQQYKGWESQGLPAAQIANARGFNDLLGNETLRAAGSWTDQQWNDTHAKYLTDQQSMRIDQKTADQSTAFMQKLRADMTTFGNAFNSELAKAAPQLGHLADAATVAGQSLIKWLAPKLATVAEGAADVTDTLNNGTTYTSPENGGPQYKPNDAVSGFRMVGDTIRKWFPGIPDATQPVVNAPGFKADPKRDEMLKRWESLYRLRPGVLDNFERQESSRGKNIGPNTNDSSGPAGPFQLTKDTGNAFGVSNRLDENESAGGAARYIAFLLRKYRGDYAKVGAAYDGFSGLDKAIAKYGDDWRHHLSEFGTGKAVNETRKYLSDLEANGLDLSKRDDAFANARNDANLKLDPRTLGAGESFDVSAGPKALTQQQTSNAVEMGVVSGMDKFLTRLADVFREGGGAQFRGPDARREKPSDGARAPVRVDVRVNTPPGASTNVTMGSSPQ